MIQPPDAPVWPAPPQVLQGVTCLQPPLFSARPCWSRPGRTSRWPVTWCPARISPGTCCAQISCCLCWPSRRVKWDETRWIFTPQTLVGSTARGLWRPETSVWRSRRWRRTTPGCTSALGAAQELLLSTEESIWLFTVRRSFYSILLLELSVFLKLFLTFLVVNSKIKVQTEIFHRCP